MKKTFLSSFILKIIAIITMTIDHIGVFLQLFAFENVAMAHAGIILNCIGRISFPLFVLFTIEGALKTHNWKKYVLRLSLIGLPILLFQIIGEIITQTTNFNLSFYWGNIFITLILLVLMVVAFEDKRWWVKLLGILPILYFFLGFFVTGYEFAQLSVVKDFHIWWFPYMIRPQYDILAALLGLSFYGAHKGIRLLYQNQGLNPDLYDGSENYQFGKNLMMVAGLIISSFILFALNWIIPSFVYWRNNVQLFAMIAGIFILFYNGKRGYHSKWFSITSYIYFPTHLSILYGIFMLITYI